MGDCLACGRLFLVGIRELCPKQMASLEGVEIARGKHVFNIIAVRTSGEHGLDDDTTAVIWQAQ